MKIARKLAVPVFLIAGGLAYIAAQFTLPTLIPFAMGIFGLFAILLGIETLVTGSIEMFNRFYSRREFFSGLSAYLFGVIIFLFGLGVTLYTIIEWIQPGLAGKYLEGLLESSQGWGILLAVVGFFTLLFGLIRLVAGSAHQPEEQSRLTDLGYRVRGLINIVFGAGLLVAGIWFFFN